MVDNDDDFDAMFALDEPMPMVPAEGALEPNKYASLSGAEILELAKAAGGSEVGPLGDEGELRAKFEAKKADAESNEFAVFLRGERSKLHAQQEADRVAREASEAGEASAPVNGMPFDQDDPDGRTDFGLLSKSDFELTVQAAMSGNMDALAPDLDRDSLVRRVAAVMPRSEEVLE